MEALESEEFIKLLTQHQEVLFYYIRTLVRDTDVARDVLQETNMVLWRKIKKFKKGTSFLSWSRSIAHFQVLAWYRDHQREQLLFDDELVSLLAKSAESETDNYYNSKKSLKKCLELLPENGRQVIDQIYEQGLTVSELAEQLDRTPNSVSQILYRMRSLLKNCMNSKLEDE